ncbi:MAG: hypothetical protein FJ278_07650, partial [Planctomycetes bacterium]|nr:hypothetical protein [Planctomycetota bacterium]
MSIRDEIRVWFDLDKKAFSCFATGSPALGIASSTAALEVDGVVLRADKATRADCEGLSAEGEIGKGGRAVIVFTFGQPPVVWRVEASVTDDGGSALLGSEITNKSDGEVTLGKCRLLDVSPGAGKVVLGPDKGDLAFLECWGTQRQTRVRRAAENDGRHLTKIIAHLYNPSQPLALHAGFVTYDRANTEHAFSYQQGQGVQELRCYCDFDGFTLKPGASIRSETLLIELQSNPYRSLERWADRVQAHYQPRIWPGTPAGWVGWSWVDGFNVERYEDVVLRNARALKRRLDGFGIEYIWVSIGNLKDGLPGNWLEFSAENFPSGVEALVAELSKLGLKLGFWVAPFWICSHLKDKVEQFKDALLRKPDGSLLVTRSEWQYGAAGKLPKGQRPVCYALDGSYPKTVEWLKRVFSTYRKWGIRYYMIDFLEAGSGSTPGAHVYGDYHDRRLVKGPEVYRNALKAVREAAGEDTYLLASSGPTLHDVGLVDAVRTGNDYGEGRALYPDTYFYPATFVINSAGYWTSHAHASNNMAATYFTHRKLYVNDS